MLKKENNTDNKEEKAKINRENAIKNQWTKKKASKEEKWIGNSRKTLSGFNCELIDTFIGKDMYIESYANITELSNICLDIKERNFNALYTFEELEKKLKRRSVL